MNDSLVRGETARPRRVSAAADLGANVSLQDGEVIEVHPPRETHTGLDKPGVTGGKTERRNSGPQAVHQRHMPMEPLKFHIPRKTKENRALFQYVSTESREYEDMLSILTSSYIDTTSTGCFTYGQPRLVHSDLEKEFVEKRKEMKADGRTDKELEESYCFLMADTVKLHPLCEKGLFVGQSWITVLGNPNKGVYLSRYSDLLQINALAPGATGEIIIFKVMKGKVKSIYENMKNLLDPTPRFDSHISKNASKVTSLTSYRAFELTQQYFYEYSFDELRQRPRQVCPYAVVSFHFKGKDSSLPSKPLAPIRLNSQSSEGSKERAQYTVWTGDLVKGDRVLFQISLRSFSPPFLAHRLPEKLEIGYLMRIDQVTKLISSELFSYNLYNSSQEVETNGYCCSLLEVIDRSRSTINVTRLLQELEIKRVVLVTELMERGFLFLLSSVQMATPSERGENWKRCLQALFVFPESRDMAKSTSRCASSYDASHSSVSAVTVMPRLKQFIPALHHALIKARANPPPELSAGVEHQVREYFIGLNDGKVRNYPMGEYDSKLDERGKMFPAPRHHRVNMDSYLRSYLYSPTLYLLQVACAKQITETLCSSEEPQQLRLGGQRDATGNMTSITREGETNAQKMQHLIDHVLTCKRNAENEVYREEAGPKVPGRKRRLEQETAARTLKFLKASREPGRQDKIPVEGNKVPASPGSLESVFGSVGLKDSDLRKDGSEVAARLLSLLTGLSQTARGTASQSLSEWQQDSSPFGKLATKLGLPTNCDIDLRKQEDLEDQTTGSISSLEGFSPGSHCGETNHHGATRGGGQGRRAGGYEEQEGEEWQIPWVLIPITGLCSERYTHRDKNIPQDPRFQHLTAATNITTATKVPRRSPAPSPSLLHGTSPEPSLSQYPSPDASPPLSPSQCPSPEPSPPPSPSQVLLSEPSPPTSLSKCPSPQPSPPTFSSQCSYSPSLSHWQPAKPNELNSLTRDHSGANKEQLAPTVSKDFTVVSLDRKEKPQGTDQKNEEPSILGSIHRSIPPASDRRIGASSIPTERCKDNPEEKAREVEDVQKELLGKLQKGQGEAKDVSEDVKEVVGLICEKEQNIHAMDSVGRSVSSSVSSPAFSVKDIDRIVDKHLDDFSSDIQLLLQEQSIHCNFSQSPHSTSNTEATENQNILPHALISQFSEYVSFYNPCPPVQDYVHSLQNSINSMLTDFEIWPSHNAETKRNDVDAALASSVSAFVAGIRAANASTDQDGEVSASSEHTTADVSASVSQAVAKQLTDATNNKTPQISPVTLSVPTSVSAPKLHPSPINSPQSHWQPQQNRTLEISRTATQSVGQLQDHSPPRTVHGTTGLEAGGSAGGPNCAGALPGFTVASKHLAKPSQSFELVSSSVSVPGTGTGSTPPTTALSSLISQLHPEVFSSLVEIIKDVKRNSLQFYLHSSESEDPFYKDIKELLLKQGNTEQNPVAFLNQEKSDNRLLVIIRNKDISGYIHKIPGLMSLKRHPSVVFVGIDTLDDIRNNSYIELFVSGGCIVSDDLILNPDFITHDRLLSLLMFLEQHSSPESVWKWKVHCKTHKKLKEQARFRKDAANLLDILSTYQKRQIVEFLPYHHCDMMNHQSPNLDCIIELQGRYTQYRHTVFLTEHHFERFAAYSGSGIIVASIEEILCDFTRLVGYHDIKDKQPIMEDLLSPKEHTHPLSSCDQPQHSGSGLPSRPHLADQLVPDTSCKITGAQHSDTDFEALRQAISHLRAERQARQQHKQLLNSPTDPACVGSGLTRRTLSQVGPTESVQLTHCKKAVTDTLEFIHSALHPEPVGMERRDGRVARLAERLRKAAGAEAEDHRGLGLLRGSRGTSNSNASSSLSVQNTTAVAGPSNQPDSTSDRTEDIDQQREPADHNAAACSTAHCRVGGKRPRNTLSGQEQPTGTEGATPGNTTTGESKLTGSITKATGQVVNSNPVLPRLQQLSQPRQVNEQQQLPLRHSRPQPQQQWGVGLLQPPHLARLPRQSFSSGHMLGPLSSLGGIRSILGPTPVWTGGLGPTSLLWRFPQAGNTSLLGGYHNPAGQGGSRYRGGATRRGL